MIKVNLLQVKKKKKAKPVPKLAILAVVLTLLSVSVMAYVVYFYNAKITAKKAKIVENDKLIAELKEKIKAVENFEALNATFKKRKEIIEQLGKNRILPVKILEEVSKQLPPGVWLTGMSINGGALSLSCIGFTNTDVVNFVNNLKNSSLFTDVYLTQSVQTSASGFTAYSFGLTFRVK